MKAKGVSPSMIQENKDRNPYAAVAAVAIGAVAQHDPGEQGSKHDPQYGATGQVDCRPA